VDFMKVPRRRFLHLAAVALAAPALLRTAKAQAYPARPVRIVLGFAAGGAPDIAARLVAQWLSERLGQQFIVENRVGAGGKIATEAVIESTADGYTLLMAGLWNAVNATLYEKLKFDFIRDIAPVASVSRENYGMEVQPTFPAKTVPEFIAYAKANPGKLNMASAGNGTGPHMAGELFKIMAGVDMVHIAYRGSPPALTDLIAGQVQLTFGPLSSSIEFVKTGRLRALGVTSPTRLDVLPDVPAIAEFVPGYEASGWYGVCAPAKTPAEIVDRLNREINAGLADAKLKARFADVGATVFVNSPAGFAKHIADETEKWGKVVRTAHLRAD
jgi:tripartite-type tricarboxylate transporter receptor subunit TctC